MANSARSGRKSRPRFKLAMRGYDSEVEAFLAQLSDYPDLPVPGCARVVRGYDPEQVDLHIQQVKDVRQPPLSQPLADPAADAEPGPSLWPRGAIELHHDYSRSARARRTAVRARRVRR